jgi:hypothetical protein
MTNGFGKGINRSDDFAAFDLMPKAMRDYLNYEAPVSVSAQSIKSYFWRYDMDEALPMVRQQIEDIARRKCMEIYGPDHPQSTKRINSC